MFIKKEMLMVALNIILQNNYEMKGDWSLNEFKQFRTSHRTSRLGGNHNQTRHQHRQ